MLARVYQLDCRSRASRFAGNDDVQQSWACCCMVFFGHCRTAKIIDTCGNIILSINGDRDTPPKMVYCTHYTWSFFVDYSPPRCMDNPAVIRCFLSGRKTMHFMDRQWWQSVVLQGFVCDSWLINDWWMVDSCLLTAYWWLIKVDHQWGSIIQN